MTRGQKRVLWSIGEAVRTTAAWLILWPIVVTMLIAMGIQYKLCGKESNK